jgi:hypothetical protein
VVPLRQEPPDRFYSDAAAPPLSRSRLGRPNFDRIAVRIPPYSTAHIAGLHFPSL